MSGIKDLRIAYPRAMRAKIGATDVKALSIAQLYKY
jgi:hypothetical protein